MQDDKIFISTPARRIIEKIASAVVTMSRETRSALEQGEAVARDCRPLFEAIGMSDDGGEGWGFVDDAMSEDTANPLVAQPMMDELIVYPSRTRAVDAGFGNSGRHPKWPHLTAWWPSMGLQGVMTKRWQRITVSADVNQAEGGAEALRYLRGTQAVFGAAAIWVEV